MRLPNLFEIETDKLTAAIDIYIRAAMREPVSEALFIEWLGERSTGGTVEHQRWLNRAGAQEIADRRIQHEAAHAPVASDRAKPTSGVSPATAKL